MIRLFEHKKKWEYSHFFCFNFIITKRKRYLERVLKYMVTFISTREIHVLTPQSLRGGYRKGTQLLESNFIYTVCL